LRVIYRCAHADVRGAAQVLDRGVQAVARGAAAKDRAELLIRSYPFKKNP
jgi:hypothetical protein